MPSAEGFHRKWLRVHFCEKDEGDEVAACRSWTVGVCPAAMDDTHTWREHG